MTDAVIKIKAKDSTSKAFGSAKAGLKSVGSMAASTQSQIMGLVGVGGFGALIAVNIQTAASSKKVSDALAMNVEDLSAWQYAVRGTKVDAEKIGDIFKDMSEKIGDAFATGGGEAADVFKRLNLDAAELVNKAPDKQLLAIAGALDQVGSQSEKVLIMESLGSDLSLLLPLLDDNAAGFREMAIEAEEFGAIITNDTAVAAEKLADDLEKLKASSNGLALEMGTRALPALTNISTAMTLAAKDSGILMALWVGLGGVFHEVVGLEGSATARIAELAETIEQIEALKNENKSLTEQYENQMATLQMLFDKGLKPGIPVYDEIQNKVWAASAAIEENTQRTNAQREALEKLQETQNKKAPSEVEGGGSGGGTAPSAADAKAEAAALKDQERLAKQFERLNISLMTEQDRLSFHYEEEIWIAEEHFQTGLITDAERMATIEALETQHYQTLNAIKYKGMSDSDAFATAFRNNDLKSTMKYGAALTSAVAGNNKGLFKANQMFTAANAAMELPGAVMSSYAKAGGFPWGIIPAGITLATGLSQIGAIKSSSFSGGGGSPSIPSGGGYTPPSVVTTPTSSQVTDVSSEPATSKTTIIIGTVVAPDGHVRDVIAPALKALIDEEDYALITEGSRQFVELQPA